MDTGVLVADKKKDKLDDFDASIKELLEGSDETPEGSTDDFWDESTKVEPSSDHQLDSRIVESDKEIDEIIGSQDDETARYVSEEQKVDSEETSPGLDSDSGGRQSEESKIIDLLDVEDRPSASLHSFESVQNQEDEDIEPGLVDESESGESGEEIAFGLADESQSGESDEVIVSENELESDIENDDEFLAESGSIEDADKEAVRKEQIVEDENESAEEMDEAGSAMNSLAAENKQPEFMGSGTEHQAGSISEQEMSGFGSFDNPIEESGQTPEEEEIPEPLENFDDIIDAVSEKGLNPRFRSTLDEKESSSDSMQRAIRVPLEVYVRVEKESKIARAFSKDISETGVFLAAMTLPIASPGETVMVEIDLPGSNEPIWAKAKVVRGKIEKGFPSLGLAFQHLTDADEASIKDYIDYMLANKEQKS